MGGIEDGKQTLVLAVDDTPEVLGLCRRLARGLPVRLICATCAAEALVLMEKEVPALVISDYGMPGITGIELLKLIRSRWPGVRVMLHTGDRSVAKEAGDLGIPLLLKPEDTARLREYMRKAG